MQDVDKIYYNYSLVFQIFAKRNLVNFQILFIL